MEIEPSINNTQLLTSGALSALVRRPQPDDHNKLYPALVMLHGRGANERDIYELVPFVDKGVLVAAARAPFINENTSRGSFKWYEYQDGASRQLQTELVDHSVTLLVTFIKQLSDLTGVKIDPAQIFIGGFSQGAMMSLTLASQHPQLVAGLILHSGFVTPETAQTVRQGVLRDKAAFVAHGSNDQVLTIEKGREIRDVLQEGGADLTYCEYPIAHATSSASRQDLAQWLNQRLS